MRMAYGIAAVASVGLVAAALAYRGHFPTERVSSVDLAAHPATKPNVLFIVWDTVRADRLSLYGHGAPTTPYLDAWAEGSLVFENAISPSYWTLPSHASLFTGLQVSSHGANADYKWLDSRFITVAEWFRDHGYATYAWSSNPNINRSANTVQGFETFHQPFAHNHWRRQVEHATKQLLHPKDRSTQPSPDRYKNLSHHKGGAVTHRAFTGWIDDEWDRNEPFFAFLNYMEAHAYRLPSLESRKAIMSDEERFRKGLTTSSLLKRQTNVMYGRWKDYMPKQRRALLDVYDASIRDLDLLLHELLMALDERGLTDDTIVVITSDHGEQFGEHGLYLHNYSVYQPLVHVPLVIRYPRKVDPGRVPVPVNTVSLFGTLVELAGLPFPDAEVQAIDRHSLLDPEPRPVVTELTAACANPERRRLDPNIRDWTATYRAVYDGGFKYIQASNGQHELYHVASDPREQENLVRRKAALAGELHGQLEGWMAALPQYASSEEERALSMKEREEQMSDELMQELEELGYIE